MTKPPPLRARAGLLIAAAALAGVLVGCSGDPEPTAATSATPAATTAVPTSAPASPVDRDRDACHQMSLVGDDIEGRFDPATMGPIGLAASQASDPGIRAAGGKLVTAFANGRPEPGMPSVEAQQASLDLATACAAKYGDGPW